MTISMEVQLERMDSKLEKHIGVTETILQNQAETLHEIRDIVRDHANKFVGHDEVELMEIATLAKAGKSCDLKLSSFEERIDKKYSLIGGVLLATLLTVFALIEIIPLIGG